MIGVGDLGEAPHIWADVAGFFFIVLESINIFITLSWPNLLTIAKRPEHGQIERALMFAMTILFSLHFVYKTCFPSRFKPSLWLWLELPVTAFMFGLLITWWPDFGNPTPGQLFLRVALSIYRIARMFQASPGAPRLRRHQTWHRLARPADSP